MSFDVNKYRNPNETEKEWQLKKLFIERCHAKFDEDRLLCLAQCYVNIETMGCRYSNEIMKQINELTADFGPIVKERIDQEMRERRLARPQQQGNKNSQQSTRAFNQNSNQQDKRRAPQNGKQLAQANVPLKSGAETKKKDQQFLQQQQLIKTNPVQILSRNSAAKPQNESVTKRTLANNGPIPSTPNNSLASLNSNSRNGMDFITFVKANMAPSSAATFMSTNTSAANSISSPALGKNKSYLGKLTGGNSSSSANTSLSVPNTTTELAPAPSLVPIPTELASTIRFDLGLSAPVPTSIPSQPIQMPDSPAKTRSVRINPNVLSSSTDQETNRLTGLLGNLSTSLPVPSNMALTTKPDPFAFLVNSVNKNSGVGGGPVVNTLMPISDAPTNSQSIDDIKFKRLNKINKLREFLRKDFPKQRNKFNSYNQKPAVNGTSDSTSNENNLINYLRESCEKYGVRLNYVQYHQAEENTFFGELYLESFRFMSGWDKKRKRCCFFAHKKALNLLASPSELAVKHVTTTTGSAGIDEKRKKLKMESKTSDMEIDDQYELYQIDGGSTSNDHQTGNNNGGRNIINELVKNKQAENTVSSQPSSLNTHEDLNAMLKSMLIKGGSKVPRVTTASAAAATNVIQDEAILATSTPATSAAIIKPTKVATPASNKENEMVLDNSNESKDGQDDDDGEDEDENENTKQGSDRRTKIKAALGTQFCLFLPPDIEQPPNTTDISALFHEKNAISVLTNSTGKSNCRLDFEIKTKIKAEQNQSTKSLMSGDRLQSESDDENTDTGVKRKYKCKIIINGVKIASGHSKNKADAKRQASLKACKYLAKFYPLIKESSYAYTSSSSSSTVFKGDENKKPAGQNETAKSLPHESSSSVRYYKIPKEALFSTSAGMAAATTTLLPPTSFEMSATAGSAVSSSSPANILNILTIKNHNSLPPALTTAAPTSGLPIYSQFGHKMLAKMGWKGQGHGLGKTQQGITKPIEVDSNAYRFGLGCRIYDEYDDAAAAADEPKMKDSATKKSSSNDNNNNRYRDDGADESGAAMDCDNEDDDEPAVVSKDDQKPKRMNRAQRRLQQQQKPGIKRNWQTKSLMTNNIRTILINYANSEAENDLIFEKNLSSEDRKLVHQEAHKLGLKTRSQGVEPNRFIVISKKRTSKEIFEAMVRNGGQSSKFQLLSTGEQPPK